MTSPFVQFFLKRQFIFFLLSPHQIWFNLDQGKKVTESAAPPLVENVLNRPGEIGLNMSLRKNYNKSMNIISDISTFLF